MNSYLHSTIKVRYVIYADQKGYIDVDDLRRASAVTGVELTEDEVEEMVRT